MKRLTLLLKAAICLLVLLSDKQLYAQANETLSNLISPTAVNVNLLPGTDNTKNLGSSNKSWKDIYLDGFIYMDGSKVISNAGTLNWFFGFNAGNTTVTGSDNTAVGTESAKSLTTGFSNTILGSFAGSQTTTGERNVFVGDAAGYTNTTGVHNTAVGSQSLYSNTYGHSNTAQGVHSLYSNIGGFFNTANGAASMYSNISGHHNTASGTESLYFNTTGESNTAIGSASLYWNSSGYSNTAVGAYTLNSNVTGIHNTAMGDNSLHNNSSGSDNTAIGYFAGQQNIASANAFFGYYSGQANTTGTYNSFFGYNSGIENTTGSYNMFFGRNTGYLNTDGSNNIAIGYSANSIAASNDDCTFLGNDADNTSSVDRSNSMALGNTARITASNQVRVGNSAVTSIGGYAGWSNVSDGRFKKNVNEDVPGLEFIAQLRPVTYTLDITSLRKANGEDTHGDEPTSTADTEGNQQAINEKEKIVYTGFIAQEVEKAAKELKYDFSGVDAPKNENDFYGLRYAEFVVPLVKAVQELNEENKRLSETLLEEQSKNTELEKRMEKLEQLFSSTTISDERLNTQVVGLTGAKLEQNIPNPFEQSTTIKYFIPDHSGDTKINIYSERGEIIKSITVTEKGNGQIILNAADLASGAYQYTLVVNGQVVATKQMIRTK